MENKSVLLSEMVPKVMAILDAYGYEKHTLWGNIYGAFSSVQSFYAEQGMATYDPEITKALVSRAQGRYESGEISRPFFCDQCRAAKRFTF